MSLRVLLLIPLLLLAVTAGLLSGVEGLQILNADPVVMLEYRLPRVVLAILAGAGLGLAGGLIQGVIRNPLASPDVLGITQGAGLAASVCLLVFPAAPFLWLLPAGMGGSLMAALAVWLLGKEVRQQPARLALIGIALGSWMAAGTDWLLVSSPMDINSALVWLTGSLWGRGWEQVGVLLPWLMMLLIPALALAYRLDLMALGDEAAEGLGVGVGVTRRSALLIAVLLAGASVAVCGTLSFVGLVAPHLARLLAGGGHRNWLILSALLGALLVLLADTLARVVAPPLELPAGVVTALIGAPYFLFLLSRYRGW